MTETSFVSMIILFICLFFILAYFGDYYSSKIKDLSTWSKTSNKIRKIKYRKKLL